MRDDRDRPLQLRPPDPLGYNARMLSKGGTGALGVIQLAGLLVFGTATLIALQSPSGTAQTQPTFRGGVDLMTLDVIPRTASVLAGSLASSRIVDDGRPPWTLRK